MADMKPQPKRTNRVFKSLHKPLTYLGVERSLFYLVCVGAVGAFNLFNSILAGIAVFIGGYGFAHGEPGAKRALAGVAAGTGIAVLAVNVLSWLWGV